MVRAVRNLILAGADKMNLLSVIIPVGNDISGLADLIERVLKVEPELIQVGLGGLEILIVDDCSSPQTFEIVERYTGQDVRLVRHSANRHYGSALKTGFRHAQGDYLAFMNADCSDSPEYYPKMFIALKAYHADVVIGSRMAEAERDMARTRRIGDTVFAGLASAITQTRITDSTSSLGLLKRKALETLYPLPDGLGFMPAMIARALHEDIKIVEVPIRFEKVNGRGKRRVTQEHLRSLVTILGVVSVYNPARLLGALAIGAIGLAALAILPWLIAASGGVEDHGGYALLLFVAMTLAIIGVNLFSIGTVFNYIVSLFHRRSQSRQPLEYRFGVTGIGLLLVGIVMFVLAVTMPSSPDPAWFLLVPSAMFVMSGIQLGTSCLLIYVLRQVSHRALKVDADLGLNIDPMDDDTIMLSANDTKALV